MLILLTILWFVLALLVLVVAGLVYALVKSSRKTTASNMFDLTEVSVPCSSGDVHCLCKKGNESQKICFQGTSSTDVKTTVPTIRFSQSFSLPSLPTDENQPQRFHVLNVEYGAFRHPTLPDPTLCFRKISDPNDPLRLCFTPLNSTAFLTGPTKVIPETI
jgi:hypothetical protein